MKGFFKILFGSCLGTILALFLIIFVIGGIGSVIAMQFDSSKEDDITANSVLHLKLEGFVPERTNNVPFSPTDFESFDNKVYGIHDLVRAIEAAKTDKQVKGIVIDQSTPYLGMVKSTMLREALDDFKNSGKFIYSYGDYYSMMGYYLASVSDKIILNPLGGLDVRGFGYISEYYTDLFDKLGIKAEVYYAGKFKSATEPYRRTNMSPENREQVRSFLEEMYDSYLTEVSSSRPMSKQQLNNSINAYDGRSAEHALESGMIDQIGYSDELLDIIRDDLDFDPDEEVSLVSINKYVDQLPDDKNYSIKDKIAVVYAEGVIGGDEEVNGQITQKRYIEVLRDIRTNDKIKAIVLRVDSPGGSALLSDKIWRELSLCRAEGKPVVVSMGNYAASGGYYISCASDKIFAEENTITGSIGVFAVLLNMKDFWNDKVHIDFDTLGVGRYSTDFTSIDDRSIAEKKILQEHVDYLYATFLKRVADNRGMSVEQVNEVAQGRVWTGRDAVEVGLVDQLGGLNDAIITASELAGLDEYRTSEYPKIKDPLQQIVDDVMGTSETKSRVVSQIKQEIKHTIPYAQTLLELEQMRSPQARLPMDFDIR